MLRRLVTIALCTALTACSGPQLLDAYAPKFRGEWTKEADIAYGDLERQKLDLYKPAAPGPHPVLIFVHGGSWYYGNKDDYPWLGRKFASEGYLTAVINYRLAPENPYPAFVEDTAKAVAFMHDRAADYGGDPDRLFVSGHSAGAYNVVQAALAPEFLAAEGKSADIIDGVAALAGPFSFLPLDSDATKDAFGSANDLEATQPINRISADAPPMLFLHGADDDIVRPKNSTEMALLLSEAGVRAESIVYDDMDHIEIIVAVPLVKRAPVTADMLRFFEGSVAE